MRKRYAKHQIFIVGFCIAIGITIIATSNFNLQPANEVTENAINADTPEMKAAKFFSQQPLRFIRNKGQADENVEYHVQGAGHTVLFNEDKIVLRNIQSSTERNEITLQFKGANPHPNIKGQELLAGVAHFYKGSDPKGWQQNVKTYGSVLYQNLYPGINMAYIGDDGILESEFYVAPGTDYHQIRFNYQGIKSKEINNDGALVLVTNLGELIEKAPYAYQDIDGIRKEVEAEFVLLANAEISFEIGNYNEDYPLIIDPELAFITTVSSITGVWFESVVFDSNGNLVLAGAADRFFNADDEIDGSNHEGGLGNDGLLVKLDGTTGEVIFSALLGGSKTDYFRDVTIDEENNLFLSGLTASTDLPVMNADQNTSGGDHDAFFTKINSSGELTYSTYLGGSERDWGEGIAMDESGNVYVGGRTKSDDFPILGAFQQQNNGGEWDMFVTKFSAGGSKVYSTYIGGSENDRFTGIAVNISEMATISGVTESPDFPLKNAYQETFGGGGFGEGDAFVSRFNTAGNDLVYSTYLGGDMSDWSYDIAVSNEGYTYITGGTASSDFPLVNGPALPESGDADGIVAMLDNDGQPMYSVRTNIAGYDEFNAIALDDSSIAYPVGTWEDSIRIYEKSTTDTLHAYFEFEAEGHQVNSVDLSGAELAFAGVYFETTKGFRDSGQGSAGKTILDQYHIILVNGCLNIIAKPGTNVKLFLNVNEFGNVTLSEDDINATYIKAEQVFCIFIKGNSGNHDINLLHVNKTNFPFIAEDKINIRVDIGEGKLTGQQLVIASQKFRNWVKGSKGNSVIYGGELGDVLIGNGGVNIIDGRGGDDKIIGRGESPLKSKSTSHNILKGGEGDDVIFIGNEDKFLGAKEKPILHENFLFILNDSLGIDTLDFSQLDSRITLDLSLLDTEQSLDDEGTKVILEGIFEILKGTEYDDIITVTPLDEDDQLIVGNGGNDVLNFKALSSESTDDGSTISTPGYGDIHYTGIEEVNLLIDDIEENETSDKITLSQNQPNPFDQLTSIQYLLKEGGHVILKVYNSSGKLVSTLVNEKQRQGRYNLTFDATDLAQGIYFYSLKVNNMQAIKKMVKR